MMVNNKTNKQEPKYEPVEELPEDIYRKKKARHKAKLRRLQRIRKAKIREGDGQ